jgi:nitric oxide reductase subunit C
MLSVLVGCFLTQSYLVYSDPDPSPPLDQQALVGRRVWHERGCQTCHQLYGFGGFLGPDLTNASPRLAPDRLRTVLTVGSGAMPAFGLSEEEIAGVAAFLAAVDRTGRGQLRLQGPDLSSPAAWDPVIAEAGAAGAPPEVRRGSAILHAGACRSCHAVPGGLSPVGAPDLSQSSLAAADLDRVLQDGRPPMMPPAGLEEAQRADLVAFLLWLRAERDRLLVRAEPDFSQVAWWEFR